MRRKRMLAVAAALSLLSATAAPDASAHARVVSTSPAEGAVVATAPAEVTVRFDDVVRVLGGTVVVRNSDKRPVVDGKARASGRIVVIPLQKLANDDYSVRWRVLSNDGHTITGVFAFAVGAGRAPPTSALSAGGAGPRAVDLVSRWLFFAGLLIAVGVALFLPLAWRPALKAADAEVGDGVLWALAFGGFFLAFLGASGLVPHHDAGGTRFGLMYEIGGVVAIVGATLAAIALVDRRVGRLAFVAALALLPVPSLAGHALDRGQWRPLNVFADMLHVGAAAIWIGGLLALAVGLPRAGRRLAPEQRSRFTAALVPRLSGVALVSVALIAATGLVRALSEFSAISQLWSSGYGRALMIKTAFLAVIVSLGWINRSRLVPRIGSALGALRRNVAVELILFAGIVIGVAFLTDLTPGRQLAHAVARPATRTPQPIQPPPPGATVLATESGDRGVGLAVLPGGKLQATVLGPDNRGVDGLALVFRSGGKKIGSSPCGPGCYRAVAHPAGLTVAVLPGSSPPVSFRLPVRPQPGVSLVARARRAYGSLRSLVIYERLASSPRDHVETRWQIVAPSRLTYVTSGGARAVVIGARRWDRIGDGPWQVSSQTPLQLPGAQWGPRWLNAKALGWMTIGGRRARFVSFFDPLLPAWFEMALDPRTNRPLELEMTAAAHFMHHRYSDFNRPLRIVRPR